MIMKYIDMAWEDFSDGIKNAIEEKEQYKNAQDNFYEYIKSLDNKLRLQIEAEAIKMETVAIETAYDKGFQEGVKFIMECCHGKAGKCA